MPIPYASLKTQFRDLADDLIDEVNNTEIVLCFTPSQTTGTSVSYNSLSYDVFGNPVPYNSLVDQNQSGSQQVATPVTETITGRVYWEPKEFNREILPETIAKQIKSILRVNTLATNMNRIRGAVYATINGEKCVLCKDPVSYGLMGDKFYCVSYWYTLL